MRMSGHIWEINTAKGKTFRMLSEGPNVEEGLEEFRRTHGYLEMIKEIKYSGKYGEINAD